MENNQVMNKNQWNQEMILWNSQWNLSTFSYHGSWWTNPMSILSAASCSKALTSWLWKKKVKSLSRFLLFSTPWTAACQAPLSRGFSRPEYWSGLPFPPPGDLPDPGIRARSPTMQTLFYCLSHTCSWLWPPNAKGQDHSAPFPLTSTTLMAAFIPEPPPASSKFLTSTPGPLSPPGPELGPSQRATSQPALLWIFDQRTYPFRASQHPSSSHPPPSVSWHPLPGPAHLGSDDRASTGHPRSQGCCTNCLPHFYQQATHS